MRHFCVSSLRLFCVLSLRLSVFFCLTSAAVARAGDISAADLAALDRLECFHENSLIDRTNDMVLLAILPADSALLRVQGARLTYAPTSTFRGRLVESDLSLLGDEVMRGPLAPSPVLRLELRQPTLDRARDRRTFLEGVAELRDRHPGIHLRCVYDLDRWAKARACNEDLI